MKNVLSLIVGSGFLTCFSLAIALFMPNPVFAKPSNCEPGEVWTWTGRGFACEPDDTAATLCASGEVLDGDGNCVVLGTAPASVSCAVGEMVSGFDTDGNLICAPRGRPLPPVLSSIIGPFTDIGTIITPFCSGDPVCEAAVAPLNMLNRYEVIGIGEPRAGVTLYVDGVCSPTAEAIDFFTQVCLPLIPGGIFQVLCSPPINAFLPASIGTAQVSDIGTFTSLVVTDGSVAVTSASLTAEAPSDCSVPANLP